MPQSLYTYYKLLCTLCILSSQNTTTKHYVQLQKHTKQYVQLQKHTKQYVQL